MKVKNLVSWSGETFSYMPGDIIELDDAIAQARIDAGVAAPIEPAADDGSASADSAAKKK